MSDRAALIATIDRAFTAEYPGDGFLQGSFEGSEPFDEIGAFVGQTEWRALEPAFLDEHASALSFFSEAGLRCYLPAYLVADVRAELQTADPLFHLIHGFSEMAIEIPAEGGVVRHRSGGEVLGPRRYGRSRGKTPRATVCRSSAVRRRTPSSRTSSSGATPTRSAPTGRASSRR